MLDSVCVEYRRRIMCLRIKIKVIRMEVRMELEVCLRVMKVLGYN